MGMGDGAARRSPSSERYLELVPTSSYAHQWIAICHLRLGERDAALREAEAALALDPRFTDARVLQAGVLAARGEHDAAVRELREAVATDPAKPMIRLDLAKILARGGPSRRGARRVRGAAAARARRRARRLTGLGVLLASRGDLDRARSARCAARCGPSPRPLEARFNLAQVLVRAGRTAEAAAEYRRVAESARRPAGARERREAVAGPTP